MPAGRPPKYKTAKEMQKVIDIYFLAVRAHAKQAQGDEQAHTLLDGLSASELLIANDIDDMRPTVSGLALALDMTTQAVRDYEVKDEFLCTIKKAKQRIENALENNLYAGQVVGTIFNLKNNFGWKDKTESTVNASMSITDLSADELERRKKSLEMQLAQSKQD